MRLLYVVGLALEVPDGVPFEDDTESVRAFIASRLQRDGIRADVMVWERREDFERDLAESPRAVAISLGARFGKRGAS